ncbi:hypothetical protein AVEN_146785-1 [Araneus ventricosus]|uniref:Uncharacterized protein n=1 Tax=Araneus ventricosus TaxID=182803 RepID=A0A4Y2D7A4_ARAVE|nr:hypothetical protein AVEN_146785-1 [Araneus ventricosus]
MSAKTLLVIWMREDHAGVKGPTGKSFCPSKKVRVVGSSISFHGPRGQMDRKVIVHRGCTLMNFGICSREWPTWARILTGRHEFATGSFSNGSTFFNAYGNSCVPE